jgi:riboflavin synthase
VTGLARVADFLSKSGGARLTVALPAGWGRLVRGESVAVSGVCLTALSSGRHLIADLSSETMARSTLGHLSAGDAVNLERALRWGDRLSGHFVLGHVDGTCVLRAVEKAGNSWSYRFSIPSRLTRFIVEKGSVALDGVSLTVAGRSASAFSVAVIPETRRRTSLGDARPGDELNFEADVFARYGSSRWRRALGRERRGGAGATKPRPRVPASLRRPR